MSNKNWSLSLIWNKTLDDGRTDRPMEPRDRIYASELGRSDVDIFLKMKGVPYSNPANARAKRKFTAGDLTEWFVSLILKKCGIYRSSQDAVKQTLPGMQEVSGRLDFIAGGAVDYKAAREKFDALVNELEPPDFYYRLGKNLIEFFETERPEGLEEKILEVKSVAPFAYEKVEKTNKAVSGHDLQLFHYSNKIQTEGALCYICRDDWRMYEIPILPNDPTLMRAYEEKVRRVSAFYQADNQPPNEPLLLFESELGRFSTNFNVQYSPYLTMLYGFEHPEQYKEIYGKLASSFNRVLGRVRQGKKMTPKNEEALQNITAAGFHLPTVINAVMALPEPTTIEESLPEEN